MAQDATAQDARLVGSTKTVVHVGSRLTNRRIGPDRPGSTRVLGTAMAVYQRWGWWRVGAGRI